MTRRNVARLSPLARRRLASCLPEPLEDRKLFAATIPELVTVGVGGAPANGDSEQASVSADGRYVVFASFATNLVAGDTNGKRDIFLRDTVNDTTIMISKNTGTNAPGDGDSSQPVISQNGRYVAFVSRASNLVAGDTLGFQDVFRYDIQTNTLALASSTNAAGTTFPNAGSTEPTISADGEIVSFTSFASNYPGVVDSNALNDVYARNMGASTKFGIAPGGIKIVSAKTGSAVASGNALSFDSWASADGRFITFRSESNDLTANDTNTARDTFLRDLQTNTTTLVSVNLGGTSGNQPSESNSVSGDGRFVAFQSKATDLVSNDNNNNADVFLRDTSTNTTTLLSINRFGTGSAGGLSQFPALSQDGSYATFSSTASNIVTGDANDREDVFLRDLARGPMTLISVNAAGLPSNGRSFDPFLSQNGDYIVFTSDSTDISTIGTGGKLNIFVANAPPPNTTTDTAAPTATFAGVNPISPGATTITFTVNLADDVGLNTVTVGNLTVTKPDGVTQLTATLVGVVGTGTSAVATYQVDLGGPVESSTGNYTITVPAGAIKDAAGNSALAGPLAPAPGSSTTSGTFTVSTGGTGGGDGAVGDPNGPNLVITAPGPVPASAIGSVTKGKFKWKVQNLGPGLVNKVNTTFKVYLSADTSVDAGDVEVATVAKVLKLKVGKAKAINAKFSYPTNIGDGNYFLLVKADTANAIAESNETDNVGGSAGTVLVQEPFVDLEPTVVGLPTRQTAGAISQITVTIRNNGNVAFKNALPVRLQSVVKPNEVTDSDPDIATVTANVNIKPGKTKTVRLSFTFPTLATGTYNIGATVDPLNAFPESNENNNTNKSFDVNV